MFFDITRHDGPKSSNLYRSAGCVLFQSSLRLVCSSSHELLILGISVRFFFLMQWFPLAFCMIVFRHTVGLLWTSDQLVSETSTCTGQNIETQETNIHALSGIRTRHPSNQAAADLRLRPRGYRGRLHMPLATSQNLSHTS
jgi:hypothetical protein